MPEAKTLNSLTTCSNSLGLISQLKKFGVSHTIVLVTCIVHAMYSSWNQKAYPDFRGLFASCLVGPILCHTARLWMVILYYHHWILIVETGLFEFPHQHLASVGLKWVWPTGTILENKLCMASESQITKTVPEFLTNITVKDLLVTRVIYLCVLPYRLLLFGPRDMVKPSSHSQNFRFRNQQRHSFCKRRPLQLHLLSTTQRWLLIQCLMRHHLWSETEKKIQSTKIEVSTINYRTHFGVVCVISTWVLVKCLLSRWLLRREAHITAFRLNMHAGNSNVLFDLLKISLPPNWGENVDAKQQVLCLEFISTQISFWVYYYHSHFSCRQSNCLNVSIMRSH